MSKPTITSKDLTAKYGGRPKSRMLRVREQRSERMRVVTTGLNNGKTIAEIAKELGVKAESINRLLRLSGVVTAGGGSGNLTLMVRARRITIPALDRLCARWHCTRAEAAGRIMTACLRNDGKLAEMVTKKGSQA